MCSKENQSFFKGSMLEKTTTTKHLTRLGFRENLNDLLS